jgi:soluble lytic murein transglycosylase-like protein
LRVALALSFRACVAVAAEAEANPEQIRKFPSAVAHFSPSEFDVRWNGSPGNTLASSGMISPPSWRESINRRDTQYYQNDDMIGAGGADISQPSATRRFKRLDEFSNARSAATTTDAAGVCGPSPLNPDEIRALVVAAAQRHGVEEDLAVAIVAADSHFDQTRNSTMGARGPMQLMPAMAARFGVADPCEPAASIDTGVGYFGRLLDEFANPILAIAAYNAGEHRIYEYGGIPPFAETVNFVATVVNHQLGLQAPRRKPVKELRRGGPTEPFERGVVAAGKRRQWVAGVMQF